MKLTEHEMLVTLATAALNMDDFTGHDVLESLKELGYANVIAEARNSGHHQLGDDGCCSLCGIDEEEIEKTPVCTEKARATHSMPPSTPIRVSSFKQQREIDWSDASSAFRAALDECRAYGDSLRKEDTDWLAKLEAVQHITMRIAQRALRK